MHDYSIRNESRKTICYWISVISIIITQVVIDFFERVVSKMPKIENLFKQLNSFGFSISALLIFTIIWFSFSRLIWKFFARIKLIRIPNISGKWKCVGEGRKYLNSNDVNSWKGIIQIEQEYEKISIKLTTNESKSHSYSLVGDIEIRDKNEIVLSYMYENEPFKTEEGLKQHKGFCRLIFDLLNNSANGHYYTDNDRSSYGVMKLTKMEEG